MKIKVFIYDKKTRKTISCIPHVKSVETNGKNEIIFKTESDETFTFCTKYVNSVIYQY